MGKGYRCVRNAAKKQADIFIYEDVGGDSFFGGGFSAKQFKDDLTALGDVDQINLHINSFGGDVFDGLSIYRLLVDHKAKVISHVDGIAASIASAIAMAGSEVRMAESGLLMIHNASGIVMGTAEDMEKMAAALRTITGAIADVYIARTGNEAKQVKKWMDDETWFTANEAVSNGFATEVVPNLEMAASFDPARYKFKKPPQSLTARAAPSALPKRPALDQWKRDVEARRASLTSAHLRR